MSAAVLLFLSVADAFGINQGLGFSRQSIDPKSFEALRWLKEWDPGPYYTNVGGGQNIWSWTPAAYLLEMPVINFEYNRVVASWDQQRRPTAPIVAGHKYILLTPSQPRPAKAELIRDFDGMGLWVVPDALPFAFATQNAEVQERSPLKAADVTAFAAQIRGPNTVVARGEGGPNDQLVVLVSDYPGWRVTVDGQPAPLAPVNGYLGAALLPGEHEYEFRFQPVLHTIGLAMSALSLLVLAGMVLSESRVLRSRTGVGSGA